MTISLNKQKKSSPSFLSFVCLAIPFSVLLGLGLSAQTIPIGTLPAGARIMAGDAYVSSLGDQMLIRQTSPRAAIRWHDFNVGSAASVHFVQPNSNAATLNQVSGPNPSQILGRISANGSVFITNGNGIFFGEQATVDVGGLVASTMNLTVNDFMKGKLTFKGENGDGKIGNKGTLSASRDGFIALLAPEVRNSGLILAKKGTVALASGKTVELQFGSQRKLEGIRVQPAKWKSLVENQHVIDAEEGLVILSAKGLTSLRGSVVNNSGKIQASGVSRVGGRIMLTAGEGGEVENQGLLDVSSLHGKGGNAILEGERIHLDGESLIDASGKSGGGVVLVGGDWQGGHVEGKRLLGESFSMSEAGEVIMEKGAGIDASAIENGKGGDIVLWSDISDSESSTIVRGSLDARGGAKAGDGGNVETSGAQLDMNEALVSTFSPHGKSGNWLLDPGNINIVSSGAVGSLYYSYEAPADTTIQPSAIESALNSNNLTIRTGSGGYYIEVTDPIDFTNNSSRKLVLEASGDIRINNSITVNGGVDLIAGGSIRVGQNVTTVSGGALFQAANDLLLGTGGGNVRVATGSGPITLRADRIAFDGDLSSPGSGRTTLATTGLLKIEPSGTNFHADFLGGADGSPGTEIKWKGALTEAPSGVFKFTADATSPFRFLEIENYTRLGGLSLNKVNSTTPLKIETAVNTAGPITINGGDLTIDCDLTTSAGGVTLQSAGKLSLGANDTSIRIASGNTPITLKSDWIAFDGSANAAGNGQTTLTSTGILTIAPYNANFSSDFLGGSDGSSGSELNWNGSLTEVSSGVFEFTGDGSNDFRHLVIEDYTRLGGLVLNKNNSSTPVEIETNMNFNGPITVYGGDLTIEENLSSRLSGADILFKGTGKVQSVANRTIQTNNGDIVFWSDSDGNGEGAILVGDDNVLNSANGRTGDTDSSGGKIVLGGGGNSGVVPTGNSASAVQPGVKLGASTANHTQIYSGGGDISIKGLSTATGLADDRDEAGVYQWGRMTIKSGRGSITMNGTSSEYSGVGFTDPVTDTDSGTKQLIMKSAKTSGTAIQITGVSTSGKGVSFNYLNPKEILSLGGGQIIVNGTGGGAGNHGVSLQNQDVLSTSGDIFVTGIAGGVVLGDRGARFGSLSGSGITSSSADLTIRGDVIDYQNLFSGFSDSVTTTGGVVMESQNASFSSLFNYQNINLANTVSSLRVGKTTNGSNVRIITPISISGPISIYGADVITDADVTISGGGALFQASDVLLFGSSATNVSIATGPGPITLRSDLIAFDGSESSPGGGQTTLSLTGILKIEPYNANFRSEFLGGADGSTGSILNWNGAVAEVTSGVFRFTGDGGSPFRHLVIDDYTRIGGFVLNKDSSVTPVEIETYLDVNGPITIYGGDVDLEVDLSSRLSGADVLLKGTGKVETIASRSFLTNNGDVTFWSNSDNSSGGPVVLGDDNVINSANGRTGDNDSGGGKITIGGGNNGGVVPTGYSSSNAQPGVKLGTTTANHTQIYSGGGNISIKGSSTATGLGDDRDEAGIYQWGRMTMKSGLGSILFNGTSSEYQGIGFVAPVSESDTGTKQLIMSSAKTSGTAISLTGSSSAGTGVSFNYQNPKEILSLGGGQIQITGTGVGAYGISLQNQDVLSSAGSILLYGGTEGIVLRDRGARFGSRSGTSVTNGSAALTLRGDVLDYQALSGGFTNTADGTGGVVMESHSSSFSSPFDYKNFDLGSTVSSFRVGKSTNTANVTANEAVSIAGPITFYGGDLTFRENMSSSLSGADVLLKGTGKVETIASRSFLTNNGDVTFWSNSDNSSGGPVVLGDDNVINSANGRTGDNDSGGGKITIGGGNNGGVVPTGYSSSNVQPGVKLGTTTANHTQIYSGGGNISIKGSSTATGLGDDRDEAGIYQWGRMTMKSGLGSIVFNGTSSEYQGIGFVAPVSESDTGTKQLIMSSAKTSGTAISLTGSSSAGTGVSFNYQNPKEILSLGGGQIQITGTGVGAYGISLQNQDVLSSAGSILLYGGTEGIVLRDRGARFGSRSGTSVTNGSAALTLRGDVLDYQALSGGFTNTADGTGGVVMESHSSSFSSPFDYKNFDLGSTVSSFRVGKSTNTANVTANEAVSIAGPITFYGGDLTFRENMSSSLSGADVLLKGTGKVETIASRSFLTNNGDVTFWSDSDNSSGGPVVLGDDNVINSANGRTGDNDSGGGKITIGGGNNGGVVPTGYSSSNVQPGVKLGTTTANHTQIYSGGGNISIKGSSTATGLVDDRDEAGIYQWGRMTMKSGLGSIVFNGTSSEYQGIGFVAPVSESDTGTKQLIMSSAKASGTAISLTGSSSAGTGLSFNYQNPKEILSLGGGQIQITGTGVGAYGISLQNQDVLSSAGSILLYGGTEGIVLRDRGARFGSRSGTSVTNGSAALTLRGDVLDYQALSGGFTNTADGTGGVVMESHSSSFSSPFDYKNFDLGSTVSSFRVGKSTNTANVTANEAVSIAGPISIYGGDIDVNAPLTATGSSISLDGSGIVQDGINGFLTANGLALLDGAVSLDHANNDVDLLAGTNLDSLSYVNADDLEVGTVNPSGISSTGDISISTLLGNLEISQNITSGSSTNTSVVLNAGRSLSAGIGTGGDVIVAGTPTVSSAGGRVTFYSGSVAASNGLTSHVGSGSGRFRYNSDETTTNFTTPLSTGSYAVYREQPLASIETMNLAISYQDSLPSLVFSGTLNGDVPFYSISARANSSTGLIKSGSYSILSDNLDSLGYNAVGDGSGTLLVSPKTLGFSGLTALGKTYDGTTSAQVTGTATISGFGSDLVNLDGTPVANFLDKNVAVNKSLSISGYSLSGVDASNYKLPDLLSLTASITAKSLSISGLTLLDKVYDGDLAASVNDSVAVKTGIVSGDQVSVLSTGTFADKNVGVDKLVSITNQFLGADAGNYIISGQTSGLASISPKALSVTGITTVDKVYDGDMTASVDLSSVVKAGLIPGDEVALSSTGLFSDKNVGEAKTVAFSNVFTGSDLENYSITAQSSGLASITPKTLDVSGLQTLDKEYDGGLSASVEVSSAVKEGLVAGDEVIISSTGTFSDAMVGQRKTVLITNEYSGSDVSNYDISDQSSGVASILRKILSVSGIQALNKDYDGSDAAELDLSDSLMTGLIPGDEVSFVSTGKFSDKFAGADKSVVLLNQFSGSDLENYEVKEQAIALASIIPKTVKIFGQKTFDGKKDLSGGVSIETGVEGESLSYSGAFALTASVAGPDGDVATIDNHIASITLLDATDGSGGLVSNYALPELNALNAPVEISASTIVVEEAVSAQLVDLSSSGQDAFAKNVEYGISSEGTSFSVKASLLQSGPATSGGGVEGADSVSGSQSDMGMKIEMVSRPDAVSAGIVAVTIPQGTAVSGTGFSFGLPEEISSMVSSSGEGLSITLESGAPLPSWIEYNAEGGKFVSSSVPDGAFPIKVVMNFDGKKVAIVISESQE